jgi:hypothetical protein
MVASQGQGTIHLVLYLSIFLSHSLSPVFVFNYVPPPFSILSLSIFCRPLSSTPFRDI